MNLIPTTLAATSLRERRPGDRVNLETDVLGRYVEALLAARAEARSQKNWALADAVRDRLGALGFTIMDTPQGARVEFNAG